MAEKLIALKNICKTVGQELGKGFPEKVYQEAIGIELQKNSIQNVLEQVVPVMYKNIAVGGSHSLRIDISLESYLPAVFEVKATNKVLTEAEVWQLIRYMKVKSSEFGILVNFNQSIHGGIEFVFVQREKNQFFAFNPDSGDKKRLKTFALEADSTILMA
jgi:GxxExxY protein